MKSMRNLTMCVLALGALAFTASCNSATDAGDGPAVSLQITSLQSDPVTATTATGGGCTREVTEWTVAFSNVPKNTLAITSPFNDVVMSTVNVAYSWDVLGVTTPPQTLGLGGIAVPVSGSGTSEFFPITVADLASLPLTGGTASLTMTFNGQMVDGTNISVGAQAELFVEPCP